ncbi:hypothetical protein OG413_20375 [Streptomyces sp. NBC_01433]|uniref:hypothetical protein n=1 Tax=Streptomyces sp. NBC_01433 TaxID=2903864 RepID=UPI00224D9E68|nr:hypothetical protein [Streptomyces sp. NBC_01433]MCX4677630.1 hypothetical protein [Streptomyces sp. NBC_01433]
MTHATRITTGDDQSVTVISQTQAITDWTTRYLGLWWTSADIAPDTATGPVIRADVDVEQHAALAASVTAGQPEEVTYATTPMLVIRDETGLVTATQPDDGLSYVWDPATHLLRLVGVDETAVATATARLAREIVRGQLLTDGWQILHSSAVTRPDDGATILSLGGKGAGKTTTGFLLSRAGLHLLANDRVFTRVDGDTIRVLPWPSAAAIGFGLLDALGWFEPVRARVAAGELMHPTQKQKVTDALLAGDRTPLWKAAGTEMKPQFFPDQLQTWLGLTLATEGHVAGILFPTIVPDAEPALTNEVRGLHDADFFSAATEDRYPDVFGLLPPEAPTDHLADRLAQLPHQALTMNHDPEASTAALVKAAGHIF